MSYNELIEGKFKLKEGIDYHIREVGKYLELTSLILPGFAAGIADLTARGYKINFKNVIPIGNMLLATTMPKIPKKRGAPKKKVEKKKD